MKWLQLLCLLIQTLVDFTKIMLKKTCVDNIWKFCRFMSSGRRNAPDRPFKRLNTHSMISILALHKERPNYCSWIVLVYSFIKNDMNGQAGSPSKKTGMGSSSSFISFGMEGILSTFQKIIYRRINKQRCIMLTSRPFYIDINKLRTVVPHCLDI